MQSDLLIHTRQILDDNQRGSLYAHLDQQLGLDGNVHRYTKPHLLFMPTNLLHSPQAILQAVKEQCYDARLVDL